MFASDLQSKASLLKGCVITKDWLRFIRKTSISTLKYAILLLVAAASIFPFFWMFVIATSSWEHGVVWPLNFTLENFVFAWSYVQSPPLWRAFLNSIVVAVSRTVFVLFASSLTAYALAVYKFRGGHVIFLWTLSRLMLPTFVTLIPSFLLMTWFGWVGTYWSLIIPAFISAYSVFLIRQYVIAIPREIIEAARLYGCSELGLFWRIVLPLTKPVLAVAALLNFVWAWNDFLWPSLMITERDMFTVQLALSWVSPSGPIGAALVTLSTVPLIIFAIISQKYLLKGLAGLGYKSR
jgi:ABC-type glycerol-3-phosphate transport system permease component